MAVRKRGNRWAVEVYDGQQANGKRYVGTFGSQREARTAEAEALAKRKPHRRSAASETVSGFAEPGPTDAAGCLRASSPRVIAMFAACASTCGVMTQRLR